MIANDIKNKFMYKFAADGTIVLNLRVCHIEDFLIQIRQD